MMTISHLRTFYNNRDLSDCVIKLQDGTSLFTHKVILWQEDFFKAKERFDNSGVIDLSFYKSSVVSNYIKSLYGIFNGNMVDGLSHDDIVELHNLLDFLCSKFISHFLESIIPKCTFDFNDKGFINYLSIIRKHHDCDLYDEFMNKYAIKYIAEQSEIKFEHLDKIYDLLEDIFRSKNILYQVIKTILHQLKILVARDDIKDYKDTIEKCIKLIIARCECPTNEMCVNMIIIQRALLL
jgi:hypothetical protein